jgi:hypothetical protein
MMIIRSIASAGARLPVMVWVTCAAADAVKLID